MSSSPAHVLNTRPLGQHLAFTLSLEALGYTVSHLPCLAIRDLPGNPLTLDIASQFDIVLFTSANAVRCAHARRPFPWHTVAVHAIGAATALALQTLQQPLALMPQAPFNSEAYLAQVAHLQPARLLLIKGEEGRGVIDTQLQVRGWQVTSLDLYRRELPTIDAQLKTRIFHHSPPDIISITSNQSLVNLVTLANGFLPTILGIPLVVNSQRAAELAQALGFVQSARVAVPAGDQGQIEAIQRWADAFH